MSRNHALDGVPGLLIDKSTTAMRHVGVDRLYFLVYTHGAYVPWLGAIYPVYCYFWAYLFSTFSFFSVFTLFSCRFRAVD